jgi:hypothetical protein
MGALCQKLILFRIHKLVNTAPCFTHPYFFIIFEVQYHMHRYLLAGLLALLLAAPTLALADGACGGDDGVFPGLGGDADIFGLAPPAAPEPNADVLPEDCGDAIQMDVEPRPGMLVELTSPPRAEELVCTVTSEVIETYRARHGDVDYLLAPDSAPAADTRGGASLRIAHVITADPDYVSPEGLRVGDTVERALAVAGAQGTAFTSGGLCLALPSGWTACFDPEGSGVTPGGLVALAPGAPILDFHLM